MTTDQDNGETYAGDERRTHHHLRVIFDQACEVTATFFDPTNNWGGGSQVMYARRVLREYFPDLTQQDVAILFSAVQRYHRSNGAVNK